MVIVKLLESTWLASFLCIVRLESLKAFLEVVRDLDSFLLRHFKLICEGELLLLKMSFIPLHLSENVNTGSQNDDQDDSNDDYDPVCSTEARVLLEPRGRLV